MQALGGVGGVILLVSQQDSHTAIAGRLRSTLAALPPGVRPPLLTLTTSTTAADIDELRRLVATTLEDIGLRQAELVGPWSVASVAGDGDAAENGGAFGPFSEEALAKGLHWLAQHAPPQPVLQVCGVCHAVVNVPPSPADGPSLLRFEMPHSDVFAMCSTWSVATYLLDQRCPGAWQQHAQYQFVE